MNDLEFLALLLDDIKRHPDTWMVSSNRNFPPRPQTWIADKEAHSPAVRARGRVRIVVMAKGSAMLEIYADYDDGGRDVLSPELTQDEQELLSEAVVMLYDRVVLKARDEQPRESKLRWGRAYGVAVRLFEED